MSPLVAPYRELAASPTRTQRPYALPALALLSLLAAAGWRAEVEWHGWAGLTWTRYTHWAVPAGVLAFLAWVALFARTRRARWGLPAALGLLALPSGFGVCFVLLSTFGRYGLVGLAHPRHSVAEVLGTVLALWLQPVLLVQGVGAAFGVRSTWARRAASLLLWLLALPLGSLALRVLEPAHADALHAVKTGAAVPFLLFALGLPLAPLRGDEAREGVLRGPA